MDIITHHQGRFVTNYTASAYIDLDLTARREGGHVPQWHEATAHVAPPDCPQISSLTSHPLSLPLLPHLCSPVVPAPCGHFRCEPLDQALEEPEV